MMSLIGWPRFFIRAVVSLTISLSETIGLAIGGTVLMRTDIAIDLLELFLWLVITSF